jgi:hypothetical protein
MTGNLREDQYTFLITSRSTILIKKTVQKKVAEKNQDTLLCSINFLENRAVYEIIWKHMVEPEGNMTIRYIRIAYWVPKATTTR